MDDKALIALYWARDEAAIRETARKYGKLCTHIAGNVLKSAEDCEECVNDSYFAVWNAIPPQYPEHFPAFLGKITRKLALKRWRTLSAAKRNPSVLLSWEELEDCVSGAESVEGELENRRIQQVVNAFLWEQDCEKRTVFLRRYWYFDSLEEICRSTGFGESKVKSMLFHMRRKLRDRLEKEGIER